MKSHGLKNYFIKTTKFFVGGVFLLCVSSCRKNVVEDPISKNKQKNNVVEESSSDSSKKEGAEEEYSFGDTSSQTASNSVEYPKFSFNGKGSATVSGLSDTADLKHSFSTKMSETKLELNTSEWTSNKKEAREAVQTWNEKTLYTLVKPVNGTSSDTAVDPSKLKFLLFASKAKNNRDEVVTFDPPLPVLPIPTSKSRLDAGVALGNIQFKSKAVNGENFDIIVNIEVSKDSDESYTLSMKYDIPADGGSQKGRLYQLIPMFKDATYTLDIKNKNITDIKANTLAYSSKDRRTVTVNLKYGVCAKEQGGKTEELGSGC